MRKPLFQSLLILASLVSVFGTTTEATASFFLGQVYRYDSTDLSGWSLTWSYNSSFAHFTVSAPSQWVGLGLNTQGAMQGADMMVGYIEDEKVVLLDQYAVGESAPLNDIAHGGSADLLLTGGSHKNGITTVSFYRKLVTGDSHDFDITFDPCYILWAHGPLSNNRKRYGYHTYYGSELITLVNKTAEPSTTTKSATPTALPTTELTTEEPTTKESTTIESTEECTIESTTEPTTKDTTVPPAPTASSTDTKPTAAPSPTSSNIGTNSFSSEGFKLEWKVQKNVILFTMSTPADGWVGVGFNSEPVMAGADMVVGWISGNVTTLLDQHALGHKPPVNDDVYNVELRDSSRADGFTTISWARNLTTGDSQDYDISTAPLYLLWAWGPQPTSPEKYKFHTKYGAEKLTLVSSVVGPVNTVSADGFELKWYINGSDLYATMSAPTDGWVGVGFNNRSSMTGADIAVGWVDQTDKTFLLDQYATKQGRPTNDESLVRPLFFAGTTGTNDLVLIRSVHTTNRTSITFCRKLVTGDHFDYNITDSNLKLLWAYGSSYGQGGNYSFHEHYGFLELNLVNYVPPDNSVAAPGHFTQDGYDLTWTIKDDTINFTMSAPTSGWVGVGFNSEGLMAGSDMVVGWVDNNRAVLLDQFSKGHALPSNDQSDGGSFDVVLKGYMVGPSFTSISFSRKLAAVDSHDFSITSKDLYLVWAYGPTHGPKEAYSFHSHWGAKKLNLMSGSSTPEVTRWWPTPGQALAIIVCSVVVLWGLLRFVWFAVTFACIRKNHGDSHLEEERRSMMNNSDYDEHDPVGNSDGEESQKIRYKGEPYDSLTDEETRQPPAPAKQTPPRTYIPISAGPKIFNRVYGLSIRRIPGTQIAARQLFALLLYAALNYAVLYVERNPWTPSSIGHLIAANAFLAVLPATRNSLLVIFTGLPFERTIIFHRWVGRMLLILVGVHFGWILYEWNRDGISWKTQLFTKDPTYGWSNLYGLIAGSATLIMMLTSLPIVRRKTWELFYLTHFMFIVFFVFAWLHKVVVVPFIIGAIVIYGVDRLIRMLTGYLPVKTVTFRVKNPGGVIQVRFLKPALTRWLRMYRPGQYVFVNFPKINPFTWHPFSLSSGPDERTGEINIRSLGGFTEAVANYAQTQSETYIRVDGPYGNMNVQTRRHPVVVMVAGGIGITPVLGILRDAFRTGNLSQREVDNIPRHCISDVHLVWSIQSTDQYAWFEEEFEELVAAARHPYQPRLHLHLHVTRQQSAMSQKFKRGRPNFTGLFDQLAKANPGVAKTVFVCGPKPMVRDVWDETAKRCLRGEPYDFHKETFEL